MRSIVYEDQATAALDTARVLFKRVDDAMMALEWLLARDDSAGRPIMSGSHMKLLMFRQAKSVGLPAIECLFGVHEHQIVIHDLEFS